MERFKRLTDIVPDTWNPDSPVELLKGAVLLDTNSNKVLLQLKLCNISNKSIKSVHLLIDGFDEMDESLCKGYLFAYQDIDQSPHTVFGDQEPIYLPDARIRKVHIQFSRVMFADDTITDVEDNNLPIPDRESLTNWPENLVNELNRVWEDHNDLFPLTYIPKAFENSWLCTCGKINANRKNYCARCNRDRNSQQKTIKLEFLQASLDNHNREIENKKIADEQQKIKTQKRNEARVKRIALILIPSIFVFIVAYFCFSNFILPAIQYSNANNLLNSGKYSDAKSAFINLINYKNSKTLINECDYQQAKYYEKQGDYPKAIEIFKKLESYKNSAQLANEAKYLYANSLYKDKKYEDAITIFTELGNYKDSQQQIIKCKYTNAKEYMKQNFFDKAASIFTEIGDYEDSKALAIECHYQNDISAYNNAPNDIDVIKSSKEGLKKLGDYKDCKSRIANMEHILQWTGKWIVIKEIQYSNGKTEVNTYGPYCNNEFMSKDMFPYTINIAYNEHKINDGFSFTDPDTTFTENNNSLIFTGFGQIKYVLTKESEKVLIVKGYYYNGLPASVYKAVREDDLNTIKP